MIDLNSSRTVRVFIDATTIVDRNPLLAPGRPAGIYWAQTTGKTYQVTIVREDEPVTFRGIPVRVRL